jgi:hypothetical protein
VDNIGGGLELELDGSIFKIFPSFMPSYLFVLLACLPSLLVWYNVFLWRGQATKIRSASSPKTLISICFWEILSFGNEVQAKKHWCNQVIWDPQVVGSIYLSTMLQVTCQFQTSCNKKPSSKIITIKKCGYQSSFKIEIFSSFCFLRPPMTCTPLNPRQSLWCRLLLWTQMTQ